MNRISCIGLSLALLLVSDAAAQYLPAYNPTPYDHYLAVQQGRAPAAQVRFDRAPVIAAPVTPPQTLVPEPMSRPTPISYSGGYYAGADGGNVAPGVDSTQYPQYGNWHDGNYEAGGCADGNCANGACRDGSCDLGSSDSCYRWRGSLAGLIMTRDLPNRVVLTSEDGYPESRILSNRDADVDWEGGFEVTFGRCLSDNVRWEAGYWTLNQFQGSATVLSPTPTLVTPIILNDVTIWPPVVAPGPDLASDFFDYSSGHMVLRENDVHNVELNLYYRPNWLGPCASSVASCSAWDVELLLGARYFNFDEFLRFGGVEGGANFGDLGGMRELYIESDIENHLIGAQIGALIDYHLTRCWTLYARPKVGIYGNHTRHRFSVRRGDNGAVGENSVTGESFPVLSTENDFSMLAEVDLGLRWEFGRHWSAYAAYRAVAVTGIALADEQIPAALADIHGIRDIDSNGSLLLHGVVLGVQFQF